MAKAPSTALGGPRDISDDGLIHNYDYDANANLIYQGDAYAGTAAADASWRIKKLTYDANNNLTAIRFAGGTLAFSKVWNDRTTLSYS